MYTLDKLNWTRLSRNSQAGFILEKHLEKVNWFELSENPGAVSILKNNPHQIKWAHLRLNKNPEVVQLLEDNIDKIN